MALVGPKGAGKTTLLRALSGMARIVDGRHLPRYRFAGQVDRVDRRPRHGARARGPPPLRRPDRPRQPPTRGLAPGQVRHRPGGGAVPPPGRTPGPRSPAACQAGNSRCAPSPAA
ncbi:hypothetical protein [Segeticoccus rhizosphaerae]|uniref:hypothetical protein n=1 Tax=Segeticoccus rhizosphaerae TaxID=1104777 RepID=UPI001EEF7DC6|nr:hypothetical protein [Segeticoccus rhizosphaerae]